MLTVILYSFFIFLELAVAIFFAVYTVSLLYSSFRGAPFVPTHMKEVELILNEAGMKKGQTFVELGCGDGRVTLAAVKNHGVVGYGIDINPTLIYLCRLKARRKKVQNISFEIKSIYDIPLETADVVYLFLMPKMIETLRKNFGELKKGALIISHGFKIKDWDNKIEKTLARKPFPTYYYRM